MAQIVSTVISTEGLHSALAYHCVEYLKAEANNTDISNAFHEGEATEEEFKEANREWEEKRGRLVHYVCHESWPVPTRK